MSNDAFSKDEQVFIRPESARTNGNRMILAGIGLLCVAAIGFLVAVFGQVGQLGLHAMSTLPTILSIGALSAGWTLIKAPRRIGVSPRGLTIEAGNSTRHLSWNEIGCGTVETVGTSQRRRLNITDPQGASIVRVDETFSRFDDLVALVASHVEAKADDTAGRILRKKARRQAVTLFVFGALMTLACGFVAWTTYQSQRAARLLKEKGQPGDAEIVRRFVAPNGVTKRIEYRVGGARGSRNVEVNPAYWELLDGAKSVPVIFVADEPDVSRLATGEVERHDFTKTPTGGYLLAALGGAMALFMLAASPFAWNGLDLSFDQSAKKWCLKRYGKVIWSAKGGGKQIDINEYLSKG